MLLLKMTNKKIKGGRALLATTNIYKHGELAPSFMILQLY